MANQLRKIKRNASEKKISTRDHNIPFKVKAKERRDAKERERREQEKNDKNLGL